MYIMVTGSCLGSSCAGTLGSLSVLACARRFSARSSAMILMADTMPASTKNTACVNPNQATPPTWIVLCYRSLLEARQCSCLADIKKFFGNPGILPVRLVRLYNESVANPLSFI
jgi:hypothetical protein